MTVQELIERLEKVEDKGITVNVVDYFNSRGNGWDEVTDVYQHTFSSGETILVIE